MHKKFDCQKCGECCRSFMISISYSDIMRWRDQNRMDILKEVVFARGCPAGDGFYFEKTVTAPKKPCPFLNGENLCSIYQTRPVCCRDAPHGFKRFDICRSWDKSMINKKRMRKIKSRQDKDFKNCVIHFKELLEITLEARGWRMNRNTVTILPEPPKIGRQMDQPHI